MSFYFIIFVIQLEIELTIQDRTKECIEQIQ